MTAKFALMVLQAFFWCMWGVCTVNVLVHVYRVYRAHQWNSPRAKLWSYGWLFAYCVAWVLFLLVHLDWLEQKEIIDEEMQRRYPPTKQQRSIST